MFKQRRPRRSGATFNVIFTYFLLGFILFALLGYAALDTNMPRPRPLLLLSLTGAFGGLAYAMRDRQLVLPHLDPNNPNVINPGLLADCFAGISGAYIVFLVVPIDTNALGTIQGDVKLLATGIIGGYGGRSLMDQVLGNILRRDLERLKYQVSETATRLEEVNVQADHNAEALALINRQLDPNIHPTPEEVQELQETLKAASPDMKVQAFIRANEVRLKNWRSNKPLMERTIPIFQALIQSDSEGKFHRNYGELGAALKDKVEPEWEEALAHLDQAIAIRNAHGKQGYLWYELNRAIVKIHLDANFLQGHPSSPEMFESILKDLLAANQFKSLSSLVAEEPNHAITQWMNLNRISPETLTRLE